MDLTSGCVSAALRGIVIGCLAVSASFPISVFLSGLTNRLRRLVWILIAIPFFTPQLLVGYAYSNFSLSLIHHPGLNEALYLVILWLKFIPLSLLILSLVPRSLSSESLYCYKLLKNGGNSVVLSSNFHFWMKGTMTPAIVAFAFVFQFAFSEFELASLLGIRSWTVSLFDAQAGGLLLSESLRLAFYPLLGEALLLIGLVTILLRIEYLPEIFRKPDKYRKKWVLVSGWGYLCMATAGISLLPCFIVLKGTLAGAITVMKNFVLVKELAASVLFGLGAGILSFFIAGYVINNSPAGIKKRVRKLWAIFLSLPGLLGSLLISLLMLFLFQSPVFQIVYDTPLPLLLTLTLLLLPHAIILRVIVACLGVTSSLFLARLLSRTGDSNRKRREIIWELAGRKYFWIASFLFIWGYFDLVASSLLAPSSMTTVFTRLYNLMHYGQSAVLSAMVSVTFIIPFLVLIPGSWVWKSWIMDRVKT